MTMLDLHPDELLDRARRKVALSPNEADLLKAHLAGCAVCRFVQQAARDFDEEVPAGGGREAGLDDGGMDIPSLAAAIVHGRAGVPRRTGRWARALRRRRAVLVGGLLLVGGVAAAAAGQWAGILHLGGHRSERAAHSFAVHDPRPGARGRAGGGTDQGLADPLPAAPAAEDLGPLVTLSSPPTPTRGNVVHDRGADLTRRLAPQVAPNDGFGDSRGNDRLPGGGGRERAAAARAQGPALLPSALSPPREAPPPLPVPAPLSQAAPAAPSPAAGGATALFEEGNSARRNGSTERALSLYERLLKQFDGTAEAHAARAIAGRLLLDRGRPAAALRHFDEYLAGGQGDLQEEVMVGRAGALAQLNRFEQERATWIALLRMFPHTAYAGLARSRIERLSKH